MAARRLLAGLWTAAVMALGAAVVVELGTDTHAMQSVLESHVRQHLGELAEVRPDFR